MPPVAKPLDELLWPRVTESANGCWEWQGPTNNKGYGYVDYRPVPRKRVRVLVHRAAYMLWCGAIRAGDEIDHLCRNRCCVNPAHLEPVTRRENCRRVAAYRTHCPAGHPYEGDNLYVYRTERRTVRMCKACHAINDRRRRASL